jgi:hypothetical protein
VGTFPVRGGLLGLLAGCAAGYWQLAPRSAGAANGGSWPLAGCAGCVGAADVLGAVLVAAAVLLSESRLVITTVATTAATTTMAPTTEAMIV